MTTPYAAPTLIEYGPLMALTGETGGSNADDVHFTINGVQQERGFDGSVDTCARSTGGKCCFEDGGAAAPGCS